MPAGMRVRESIVQSVTQHAVIERAISHAVAPATSREEIRRLIHVLHAACHSNVNVPKGNLLRSGDDGLRARAADAIDGERWSADREPGVDGSLPCGIHLVASLDYVAHDNRFHLIGAKFRPRDRGADGHRTESRSRNVLERASKGADRRSNRLCENNGTLRIHGKPPESKVKCTSVCVRKLLRCTARSSCRTRHGCP